MRIYLTIMASVAAAAATPALASNVSASTKAASESAAAGKTREAAAEKKICRNLETTGTRMAERVCLTAHEWKKVEQQVR